jgi:hypothetical protein
MFDVEHLGDWGSYDRHFGNREGTTTARFILSVVTAMKKPVPDRGWQVFDGSTCICGTRFVTSQLSLTATDSARLGQTLGVVMVTDVLESLQVSSSS